LVPPLVSYPIFKRLSWSSFSCSFIDALFAMWQALAGNTNLWFDNLHEGDPDATTKLTPFHKDTAGTGFDSNDVKDIKNWNYSYPPLKIDTPTEEGQKRLNLYINKNFANVVRQEMLKDEDIVGKDNDYIINVRYDRYAFDTAYQVLFFLGRPRIQDPTQYIQDPAFVGCVATFGGGSEASQHCTNCAKQKAEGVLHRGQVAITLPLLFHARSHHKNLGSLDPEYGQDPNPTGEVGVERYLIDNLHWVVVKVSFITKWTPQQSDKY
jgi:hypothetical protein